MSFAISTARHAPALRKLQRHLPPSLDVTGMSQVGNRVINNKAVRNLMTFARRVPRDVELLRRPRCDVTPVSEAYTTKAHTL
jgi:hypothetical protein